MTNRLRVRPMRAVVVATAVVIAIGASLVPPAGATTDAAANVFTIECGYVKQLHDDPIALFGQPGQSHWHDFFGNDRTDAYSTPRKLEKAMVNLATASESGTTATLTLVTGVTHSFTVGQSVKVRGVSITGYNGDWPVTWISTDHTSFQATLSTSGLGSATGGTAGDATLSCGHPHGELTYDTAAYWFPSAYQNSGQTHIIPARIRIYYFGPGENLPEGLELIGGNKAATSPADNPRVLWTCGNQGSFFTPKVDHPYSCSQFQANQNFQSFVDGPVGIVMMPYCWDGFVAGDLDTPIAPSHTVYPDQDGGSNVNVCDGTYTHKLIQLSMRFHLGDFTGTYDPCGGCLAYNLTNLSESKCHQTCTGTFTVGDVANNLVAGQQIDVTGAPTGWNGHYTIASANSSSFSVTGLPTGLASCTVSCGYVASSGYAENFTLAGGEGTSIDTIHNFYTLHADFFQTWQQDPLVKLEDDCANDLICYNLGGTASNIDNNAQVDSLP